MSRKEQDVNLVRRFEEEHQRKPFDLHEVYHWAKDNKLWFPPKDLEEKKFIEEVAQALREEYFTADDGTSVRAYHAIVKNLEGRQQTLWANMFDAPREHIEEAFQQRRRGSLADCRQLKNDIEYVNTSRFQDSPIQMSFNFDEDLAEEEALRGLKHLTKGA
jgi:hypothetical protein